MTGNEATSAVDSENSRSIRIVGCEPEHHQGFHDVVVTTLAELGFKPDYESFDADLTGPDRYYDKVWVALDDGRVVGTAAVRRVDDVTIELKRDRLLADYRGRGLGTELLEVSLGWARANGYKRAILDTTANNPAAIGYVEKAGFTEFARKSMPRTDIIYFERAL